MERMTSDERRAAFLAQEAGLRTIEIKIPREWDHKRATAALMAMLQGNVVYDAATLTSAVARGLDQLVPHCTRCGGELGWDPGMGVWLVRQPMGGWSDQCPAGETDRYHRPPQQLTEAAKADLAEAACTCAETMGERCVPHRR